VEQLTTELSSLKISMHEREADLAAVALRSSIERPASVLGRFHMQSEASRACNNPQLQCNKLIQLQSRLERSSAILSVPARHIPI